MTVAKKLTIDVPPDRIVRLPDSVPPGKVEILVTSLGSTDEPSDEERARRGSSKREHRLQPSASSVSSDTTSRARAP